jgi:hypothetical protein
MPRKDEAGMGIATEAGTGASGAGIREVQVEEAREVTNGYRRAATITTVGQGGEAIGGVAVWCLQPEQPGSTLHPAASPSPRRPGANGMGKE